MRPLIVTLREGETLAKPLAEAVGGEVACVEVRRFPDGETYLGYDTAPSGRSVLLLCSLDRPADKFLPLMFAADTAHDLGAASVGLVSPYLAYMRQDRRFRPGEAVTSTYFARILSGHVDWLVTVDPHLHRHSLLSELYDMPAVALHAAPLIAEWIRQSVERPLLVGPDEESEQWVAAVAREARAPHVVLRKIRRGDRDAEISVPDIDEWRECTPVLVDDIVSTARTMIETVRHLLRVGMRPPVCAAVHGLFAGNAYQELLQAGAARVATSNTVAHASNAIDVTGLLARAVRGMLAKTLPRRR
ncbi:ribose-phosphate pyrophosphokinase [Chelativorans xinjiangense]|uniref:ribose-phosphate pyrophosphokinase n=1 Tax=Chelativorans xinjiangense TaxID=2681485 RepID=UPI001915BDE4|nr:ribose-phosphate pyrophosphokinase [Chelativorans xinjiangense]